MSIQVNSLDEYEAKRQLKKCPKIVRDYVAALKRHLDAKDHLTQRAISKIKEQELKIIQLESNEKD